MMHLLKRSQKAGARVYEELHLVPRRCIIDFVLYWASLVGQSMHIRYSCGLCYTSIRITYAGFDPLLEIVPGGGIVKNVYPIPPL